MSDYLPAIGVVFDIDALDDAEYGRAAYRVLFDSVSPELLANTRWRDGDPESTLNGEDNRYVISIEASSQQRIDSIRAAVLSISHRALAPGPARFISGRALEREPLVVAMRLNANGVPDWSAGGGFPLEAWTAARDAREK